MEDRPPVDPHPLSDYLAWAGRRNRDPILCVLRDILPEADAHVLEFGSGSGMHVTHFAPHFPHLQFYPTDRDRELLPVIAAKISDGGCDNVAVPRHLDLADEATWRHPERATFSAVFCINVFQMAPLSAADGMMRCAYSLLEAGGILLVYGAFMVDGNYLTESNEAFDRTLRAAGVPDWGLKDVADLDRSSERHGLRPSGRLEMPADNFVLFYRKSGGRAG